MDNVRVVPNLFHIVLHTYEVNILSRSERKSSGIPWSLITSLIKMSAISVAVAFVEQGIKCAIFVSLQTTTNMASTPPFLSGLNGPKKSSAMLDHGITGICGSDRYPSFPSRDGLCG